MIRAQGPGPTLSRFHADARGRQYILLVLLALVAWANGVAAESGVDVERRLFQELLALSPGMRVADIGAGEGDYAVAMAGLVQPGGSVVATELDDEKRAALEELAEAGDVPGLRFQAGVVDGTGLPDGSVDAVLLRDVYHHITQPEAFLASLFATLRPGGRLLIVDFPPTWLLRWFGSDHILESRGGHGITRDMLVGEVEAAGFVRGKEVETWPSSNFVTRTYGVVFERP